MHEAGFGIAEKHAGVRAAKELVFDPGETGCHRTPENDGGFGFVSFDDRHAVNRTGLLFAGGGFTTSFASITRQTSTVLLRGLMESISDPLIVGNVGFGEEP
jgi:hypothetical protein